MTSPSPRADGSSSRTRRVRKPLSCAPCRDSKLRCDRQHPCATCRRRQLVDSCIYPDTSSSTGPAATGARNIPAETHQTPPTEPASNHLLTPRHETEDSVRAAVEGHARWDAVFERPINPLSQSGQNVAVAPLGNPDSSHFPFSLGPPISKSDILAILPPKECCDYLISQYFLRLSPLFHVLHGPTFQRQYNKFLDQPLTAELSWLALLFTILSTILDTMEDDDPILTQLWTQELRFQSMSNVAAQCRKSAMVCLSQDQFLIRHTLNTLETLLILIYGISHNNGVEQTWVLLGE